MSINIFCHNWGNEIDLEINKLLFQVFVNEGYTSPEDAQEAFTANKLQKRGTAIVATEIGTKRVVGVIFYVPGNTDASQIARLNEAEIHLLAVRPEYRKIGIGKDLIAYCLKKANKDGIKKIILSTQPSMKNAQHLYFKMGFIRNKERDWSRGGGKYLVYEKKLFK